VRKLACWLPLVILAVPACAAKTTAADVIARVEKAFSGVHDYQADAVISVNSPQLHVSDSRATIYFRRPDKVKVVANEGFAVMPSEAVPGDPARWLRDNFTCKYAGSGAYHGQPADVLKLTARTVAVPGEMKVWIEKKRGVILGTESNTNGLTARSQWNYTLVDGKYWMPARVKMEMSGTLSGAVFDPHEGKVSPPKKGNGTATVTISNYRINKGVPDSVFKRRK
jgi:outer membrane lipoprotein-sorting protein